MAEMSARFPDSVEEFSEDPRISYDKIANRYVLEAEDGDEWEWNAKSGRWIRMMDEALLEQQAEVYKVAGVDDTQPATNQSKKRKRAEGQSKPATKEKTARENTAVYVTNLPGSVTEGALADFFGRCGLIAESVDTNKPRIKLYYEEDCTFKGEALIVFFRPESVRLAVDLYDDSVFPSTKGGNVGNMKIFPADESYKRHKDDLPPEPQAQPAARAQRPSGNRDREKAKRKREEMNDRLMDWGEGDPSAVYGDRDRWEDRLVIIRHVFTQASIKQAIADGEDEYLDEIYEDMQDEAKKFGEVADITVYDLEEPGIVTINFRSAEAAHDCINVFHGRIYEGRKLEAFTSDGSEVFHKTKHSNAPKDAEGDRSKQPVPAPKDKSAEEANGAAQVQKET